MSKRLCASGCLQTGGGWAAAGKANIVGVPPLLDAARHFGMNVPGVNNTVVVVETLQAAVHN